jgi:hypothetical protein
MGERQPGGGRYARVEREHRWVLSGLAPEAVRSALIHDRYIDGTTLRLRRVERDGVVVFKLGQKVRDTPDDRFSGGTLARTPPSSVRLLS